MVCSSCGKKIGADDNDKGFKYKEEKYVTLTGNNFEEAPVENDKTIQHGPADFLEGIYG